MEYNIPLNIFDTISSKLLPADKVFINDGIYSNISLVINTNGNIDKPIIIIAKNPNKVILSGKINIILAIQYL